MKLMLAAMFALASATVLEAKTPQPPAQVNYVGVLYVPLSPNRWRVGYDGRGAIDPGAVEHTVAVEAAKLTVSRGFDWFAPIGEPTGPLDSLTTVDMKRPENGPHPEDMFLRWGKLCTLGWSFGDEPGGLCPAGAAASDQSYRVTTQIVMGHGMTPQNGLALNAHALAPRGRGGWPHLGLPKLWPF